MAESETSTGALAGHDLLQVRAMVGQLVQEALSQYKLSKLLAHSPPRPSSLIKLFSDRGHAVVRENICACPSILDILALTRTCKELSFVYQTLRETQ